MLVYVLNKSGKPLMPCSSRKARRLLKQGDASVIKLEPFTIRLKYGSYGYKQPITLGIDAGSKMIGVSASTGKKELFASEVYLRNDIVDLLSTKRQFRKTRRGRLRYRKSRFFNRTKSKHNGWVAPSIKHKIDSHIKIVDKVNQILPISKVIIEVAQFDIQKIKNPNINGREYQQGEQLGFFNVREYVLCRDGHKCQGRKGCKNKILQIHHIESRKTGGNRPENLITLCKECHELCHQGKLKLNIKKKNGFRNATHMNIMKCILLKQLKERFLDVECTYGYITKFNRIQRCLEKSHINDARCISMNFDTKQLNYLYLMKFVRKNNRSLHKANLIKGGIRKENKAEYEVKGFRLFDKVKYKEIKCFIFGRRQRGSFNVRKLNGEIISKDLNCKKLTLVKRAQTLLIDTLYESLSSRLSKVQTETF